MSIDTVSKETRLLSIYKRLLSGKVINKGTEASRFGVNERTIQRDIDDIREFLEDEWINEGTVSQLEYNRTKRGYVLVKDNDERLSNSDILAICKILLDSRALRKEDINRIIHCVLSSNADATNKSAVEDLIKNELFHYIEPRHGKKISDLLWTIGEAINSKKIIEIEYIRLKDKMTVTRKVKPAAIMFSEFYFYLTAFIDDIDKELHFDNPKDIFPTIYRLDRIKSVKMTDEHYYIPYTEKFDEGEFRKRIQFMFGGKLRKVRFLYKGLSIEAVLDRLPTATIIDENDGVYTIEAEVFGDGIDMWLRSQGECVEVM